MNELVGCDVLVALNLASLFECLLSGERYYVLLLFAFGCGQEVSRDAVTPPELARDTPILNVLQPVAVCCYVLCRVELDLALEHRRQSDVCEVLHREEPLLAEARLYGCVLVALRVAHLVVVVLNLLYQSGSLQVLYNLLAHVHAIHAYIHARSLRDSAVRVEDIDSLEVVRLAECVVVHVVSWSNLQTARTELDIYVAVLDNRDNAVHQRYNHLVAAQPLVLRVLRVNTHCCVAHDCLWACSSHNSVVASVGVLMQHFALAASRHNRVHVCVSHIVAKVEQMTLLVAVDNLLCREHGLCLRVPVHHAQTAVDKSLFVEVHEHLQHALRALLIHSERCAVPIARRTETAQLLEDDSTMFVCPVPSVLKELFASEVALLDALLCKTIYYLSLCSNRSVVGARYPTSILSLHACAAHEDVLNRIVEHVAHV